MTASKLQDSDVMEFETDRYFAKYRRTKSRDVGEIVIVSKSAGRHRATHNSYNVIDSDGRVLETRQIDFVAAKMIFGQFQSYGETEAFNVPIERFQSFNSVSNKVPKRAKEIRPESIIHKTTTKEKSYTATGDKLDYHWPVFKKYKDTGFGSIIRATLTNHQVCSSACQYCSTIARNKKDSISLAEAQKFVQTLYFDQAEFNKNNFAKYNDQYRELTGTDIRLRGLILSGGGQPNLWPYFSDFVDWLSDFDIDLGLITNGFPKHVPEETYSKFDWVRISITPDDASPFYPSGRFDKQYIPTTLINAPSVTVGYSYVHGPWTKQSVFDRISQAIDDNGFDYARLLTDCNLTRNSQLLAHENLANILKEKGLVDDKGEPTGKLFHQLKYHGTETEADSLWSDGQCFLQTYNVFWDTTGHEENGYSYCYPCDSVTVLAEEQTDESINVSERRFVPSKWGTYKNTEVENLFKGRVRPFFDPREICSSCLFMKNNARVKSLVDKEIDSAALSSENREQIVHINFP